VPTNTWTVCASAEQLINHPQRGALFETWVVSEIYKAGVHRGLPPALFHVRRTWGPEVDLLLDGAVRLELLEAKSGATTSEDFLKALRQATATRSAEAWRSALRTTWKWPSLRDHGVSAKAAASSSGSPSRMSRTSIMRPLL
jgi:hypothetical protein